MFVPIILRQTRYMITEQTDAIGFDLKKFLILVLFFPVLHKSQIIILFRVADGSSRFVSAHHYDFVGH
jgi:hypothetical protein